MLHKKCKEINTIVYQDIIVRVIFILILSFLISLVLLNTLWNTNRDMVHKILESLSIFLGSAIFLIIWNKQDDENNINNIIGFGFLMFSLLDIMHTYYYRDLLMNNIVKGDSSIKYWVMARLIQVTCLLIFAYKPYLKNTSKYIMLLKTLIITSCIVYVFEVHPEWILDFYNKNGLTPIKIILEYLVVIIAVFTLYKLRNNLQSEYLIKFKYLYMCILLIIPSEVCFTLFGDSRSFWVVFGHVINIFSNIYLYKSVFQSLINYPYNKLKNNNQRLVDILNAIPMAILTYDDDNKVDFINDKFLELYKHSRENILGLSSEELLKLLHEFGNEFKDTLSNRVINKEKVTQNIIRTYLDSNGKKVKVLVDAHKIEGGVLVLASDARQEQEIKNLNLQAKTILDSISTPTMIIDYTGNIVACNIYFTDLVEVNYDKIVGMNIEKLNYITNFSNKEFADTFKLDNYRFQVYNTIIETPKGHKKEIQVTTSIITNIYNEKIGLLITLQDVSKMKEEQLKLINQEKLALLGQMGATIIHETRNFLTTIKGNSQLIELHGDNEKVKKYARKINSDTDEVNRIISDFLNLSKPRDRELKEVAFNDLVSSMLSTIKTSSLIKKVQVDLKLDYDERYVLCDETQIRQVILNICKNAVEAMEDTLNPLLSITTGINESSGEAFIKISDNGKGIASEAIKRIGTPFFTTKKTGTGLGLNACYQIIREHKGRIDVESELGKGTNFTVTIPYIEEELEDFI